MLIAHGSDSFLSLDIQDITEPELDNKFKVRFRQNVSHAPDVACARLVTLACDCNANGPVNVSAVTKSPVTGATKLKFQ